LKDSSCSVLKGVVSDLRTKHEVQALHKAARYAPGESGFAVAEQEEWEKARRYQTFLDVLQELQESENCVTITLYHDQN